MDRLLENAKAVSSEHLVKQREAEMSDVIQIEEDPASLMAALDLEDAEQERMLQEALQLGLSLDEAEDEATAKQIKEDAELTKLLNKSEEDGQALDERRLRKLQAMDAVVAAKIEADLNKLEDRKGKLAERRLSRSDLFTAKELQQEIAVQEKQLVAQEMRDLKVARQLQYKLEQGQDQENAAPKNEGGRKVKPESNFKTFARLKAKLGLLRTGVAEIETTIEKGPPQTEVA